jgi:hypothetical protein
LDIAVHKKTSDTPIDLLPTADVFRSHPPLQMAWWAPRTAICSTVHTVRQNITAVKRKMKICATDDSLLPDIRQRFLPISRAKATPTDDRERNLVRTGSAI